MIKNFSYGSMKWVGNTANSKKIRPTRSKPIIRGIAISAPTHESPLHVFYSLRLNRLGDYPWESGMILPPPGVNFLSPGHSIGKDNLILLLIQSISSLVYLLASSVQEKIFYMGWGEKHWLCPARARIHNGQCFATSTVEFGTLLYSLHACSMSSVWPISLRC